ncbi:MAG: sugar phosphate nucleotidyltransferase, partial [Bacteroidota bacterium]
NNNMTIHNSTAEPWKVTLVDTGLNTMTGGRIKRIKVYLEDKSFLLTYGDGVSDVDIKALVRYHKSHGRKLTVTSVQPSGRFGALNLSAEGQVTSFMEKPKGDGAWINGGFFVCEQAIMDYIEDDTTIFEKSPLENIAMDGEMMAYKHKGFWQPMDTLRDKKGLEQHWASGKAPWKTW